MSFAEECMEELHSIMMEFKYDTTTPAIKLLLETMKKVKVLNNKYTQYVSDSLHRTKMEEGKQ